MSPPSGNLFAEAIVCARFHGLLPSLNGNHAERMKRIDFDGESPAQIAKELKGHVPDRMKRSLTHDKRIIERLL